MSKSNAVQQLNRELGDKLIKEAKQNPQSPYLGKFVGIVTGQIVVIADNLDEVMQYLERAESDASKTFCLEIGPDYGKVYEIWGVL